MLKFVLLTIAEGKAQMARSCAGFYAYERKACGAVITVVAFDNGTGRVMWTRPLAEIEAHKARRLDKTHSTASVEECLES